MKATNANVSNASAPITPPIIGPKEGLDETTWDVPPAGMEEGVEGIVVAVMTCVEEKTSVDEKTCVEGTMSIEEMMSVEEGSGDSVTAKKSRKRVASESSTMVITNVWNSAVNSVDWNKRT